MPAPDHPHFPHLFRPYSLKGVPLRNRVVISAHFAGWWVDPDGLPSEAFADYVEERAKGGVGLFVIGATSVAPGSGWLENISDAIIPRYRRLADAGHRHGMKVFAQLIHPGFGPLPGPPIISRPPSIDPPVSPAPRHHPSLDEIVDLVRAFSAAAGRAAEGGVDGLELHSHESFLHAQFLNPLWNARTDAYGGPLENRMRFLVETLEAMRSAIGPEMPLGVRLKLDDMEQRGMTAAEYLEVVRRLEAHGLVDYVNVTGGDGPFHHGPMPRPEGEWLPLVQSMRAATALPLMHAGRIATPEMAERALAEGVLDLVCMTKTHICDPHFTRKVFEGRLADIRFCTRCLQSCHGKMDRMTCVYNPVTSREAAWAELKPAARPKRVVIVGAGPAGMEAAITASGRGHTVVVFERQPRVGGQVWTGAGSPLRSSWARIAEFYERQSRKGAFEVRLGAEATAAAVLLEAPDAVIVATGSQPVRLEIAGGPAAWTVHEAIAGAADGASRVVVFDREGFNRPLVAADALSARGVAVELVTSHPQIAPAVESMMRDEMIDRLSQRGVRFHPGEELVGWAQERSDTGGGSLCFRSVRTGQERSISDVDGVVAAVGSVSTTDLAEALRRQVPELHVIGDAAEPRTVEEATYEGGEIGRRL
jgi:2,4-dienoyl-CoA reductase-like NADH-dependent reductase (Old Yellow Enzyme family)/thioredoxin reductase